MRAQALLAAALASGLATAAGATCRQALAIGLDISASVDGAEHDLQRRGTAAALLDPEVQQALFQIPGRPVRIAVYEWSGDSSHSLILPWTEITDAAALQAVAGRLVSRPREAGAQSTGIGAAMEFGLGLLSAQGTCPRLTLDLAGDGMSNAGPWPRTVAAAAAGRPVTVNALVIGWPEGEGGTPGIAELVAYFQTEVIRGPDAFVEVALGHAGFADAMRRKLLREVEGLAVSGLDPAIGWQPAASAARPAIPARPAAVDRLVDVADLLGP